MARPRKVIDQKQFEKLCGLQCTKEELCYYFDVTDKTLDAWCHRTYKKSFSVVFKEKRGIGRISLRRTQWQLAERSPAMAIFLGKNILGQRDNVEVDMSVAVEDDPITKSLKEEGLYGLKPEAEEDS